MNTFEELCEKHKLSIEAIGDFKILYEKQIIEVFYKVDKLKNNDTVIKPSKEGKGKDTDTEICKGTKSNGEKCTFKAKEEGMCGRHCKNEKTVKKKESKTVHKCNGQTASGEKCTAIASIKPPTSIYNYCARHSEKWADFEKELDESVILSN